MMAPAEAEDEDEPAPVVIPKHMRTCFNKIAQRKAEFGDGAVKPRTVSVKCTLNTLFRYERDKRQLKPLIKKQVEAVSKAFLLFQRDLERQIIANVDNPQYFADMHKSRFFRDSFVDFCKARQADPSFPELRNCSELMRNMANEYEVAFRENIHRNLRRWIGLHYEFFAPGGPKTESQAKEHVRKLCSKKDNLTDKRWNVKVAGKTLKLSELVSKKHQYHLIPELIRLNRRVRRAHLRRWSLKEDIPARLRHFNVVAQRAWGPKYVQYNGIALIQLLNLREEVVQARNEKKGIFKTMNKIPKKTPAREVFCKVFKVERFERVDAKGIKCCFGLTISTDGVGASVGLERRDDIKQVSSQNSQKSSKLTFFFPF